MTKPALIRGGHYVAPFPLKPSGSAFALPQHLEGLMSAYRVLNESADTYATKAAAIAADPNLTDLGRSSHGRDLFSTAALPALKQGRAAVASAVAEIDNLRAKMAGSAIDKTDVAGALMRREMRDWLRGMDPAQRNALIVAGELPPAAALAVIEAPPALTGVSEQQHHALRALAVDALHPVEAAKIADYEQAVAAVASAESHVVRTVNQSTPMADHQIDEALGGPSLADRIAGRLQAGGYGPDPGEAA